MRVHLWGTRGSIAVAAKGLSAKLAEESLDIIVSAAAELGITICLENMFPQTGYLFEADEFRPLLHNYHDLMITLDMGHANIKADRNRSFDFIELFADRIGHVHASDNNSWHDEHLALGKGSAPVAQIVRELKLSGYEGTLTLELFDQSRYETRVSLRKMREMWEAV